jgi:hypothetical protein
MWQRGVKSTIFAEFSLLHSAAESKISSLNVETENQISTLHFTAGIQVKNLWETL